MASGGEEPPKRPPPRIISLGSESLSDHLCDPCEKEEKWLEATGFCENCDEYLCEECYNCHTKPTPMKDHLLIRLIDGEISEGTVDGTNRMHLNKSCFPEGGVSRTSSELSLIRSTSMRLTERCAEHEEVIKYFCEAHNQLSCEVCITVHHKLCTKISYIPVVATDTRGSSEYKDFTRQKKLIENRATTVIAGVNSKIEMIRHSHAMAKTGREEFKAELQEILDKKLARLNILAVASELKETDKLDSITNSLTATLTEIETLSNTLDNPQGRTSQSSLYIALKRAKGKLASLERSLQTVHLPEVKECRFEPGKELIELLRKEDAFGKSVIEPSRESKVSHYKDISVRTQSDSEECKITGLAILPNNKLVAIDNKNRKIKLIDLKKGKVLAWLRFSHPLWDVTKISDTRVVTTVPEGERLAIVKTDPELLIENYIKVSGRCHGVAFTGDFLIVSFTDSFPDRVELLDLKGKLLNSVLTDKAGEWIFSGPKYVSYSLTSRKVYVSNWDSHSIVTMATDGSIRSVGKIEDMATPGKVVHDGKNKLYISDSLTNTVQQLSPDLSKRRKLLSLQDGLFGPCCVDYEEETDRLYVGMGIATIKVFQLH